MSCLVGGSVAALGAWAYAQLALMAAAGGPALIPALAAAFVTGCGIGTIALPGIGSVL